MENIISHNDSTYRKSIMKIFQNNLLTFIVYFKVNFKDDHHGKIAKNTLDGLLRELHG